MSNFRWLGAFLVVLALFPVPVDGQSKADALRNALVPWIDREAKAKTIPSISIALVDDQRIVLSESVGLADPDAKTPATPQTPYRVGSVSKPFTALLLMIFVEMGLIDLDAPVQTYLPDFQPTNKTGKKITLRQMLSHRSGLVREGPVGNYFDDSQPSIADTVKSLNHTELVYEPGKTTSYSNMAFATVGRVLEVTQKEGFVKLMQRKLLDPIGMTDSSFLLNDTLRKRLPKAPMWTYTGREFPAPGFEFGMLPAGNLYSSVEDQAKFLKFLFAAGKGEKGQILKKETLESMYKIQFPEKGKKAGFGLGFFVGDIDGKRVIRHGGAVYGFSTEFAALPDEKLGVIVCASKDDANAVTTRIANNALLMLLAQRAGKPLPKVENSKPLDAGVASELAGRYRSYTIDPVNKGRWLQKSIEFHQRDGKAWMFPHRGGGKYEIRQMSDGLIADDLHSFGLKLAREGKTFVINKEKFHLVADEKPKPCPTKWDGLIGEYGPDFNVLYILEKDEQLHALIEWQYLYPLKELSENVFQFPDYGLYMGDKITFKRDKAGVATEVDAASMLFKRRSLPRRAETFKIDPVRPVNELRKLALAAKPPEEKNVFFRKPELVDLTSLDKSIKLDIRYATTNNFLGTPLYTSARAFMQKPAAERLRDAHKELAKNGYGLLIHDAYRPWYVTRMFRDATPPKLHHFVADPLQGSRHNRGCAVDLTLYDLKTGKAIDMPGGYDEMTERSYADYLGTTSLQRWHRDLLRNAMEKQGFKVYEAEWWHFDYRDWRLYPILNVRFEDLKK
ncbi:MAG: serine hydrolase [Planctomycetes bacterium]|nr:serine hydrolase [Planctomycetota bacterium]